MSCYNPTIIKIYETPLLDKKITKFEKIKLDDFERIYTEEYDQDKFVYYYNKDKGTKEKYLAHCTDILLIPCGNCIGCGLDYARNWKTRLMCENTEHKKGYFLTFTYNDDYIPVDYQLKKEHAKELIKTMQNYAYRNHIEDFKYFIVGEYGGKTGRPHYHGIIWGIDVDNELRQKTKTETGNYIYTSKTFQQFWKYGNIAIGSLTPQSIGYVCRYALKKQTLTRNRKKELLKKHIQPEFMLCSKGIGDNYYIKNFEKIVENNGVFYLNGEELHTERRFKRIADKLGKGEIVKDKIIKYNNQINVIKRHNDKCINDHDTLNKMLKDKEWLKKAQIQSLKRH